MLNKTQLIGRLGKDPETLATPGGSTLTRFSLATDTRWTDKDGRKQSRTEWHSVTAWGSLAEICATHLRKGRLVYVEGRLQTRQWEDAEGNRRQATGIVIHDLKMLEPRQPVEAPLPDPSGEEIPF